MPRILHHHELFKIQRVGHGRCSSVATTILEVGSIVHLKTVRSLAGGHRITLGDGCDQGCRYLRLCRLVYREDPGACFSLTASVIIETS